MLPTFIQERVVRGSSHSFSLIFRHPPSSFFSIYLHSLILLGPRKHPTSITFLSPSALLPRSSARPFFPHFKESETLNLSSFCCPLVTSLWLSSLYSSPLSSLFLLLITRLRWPQSRPHRFRETPHRRLRLPDCPFSRHCEGIRAGSPCERVGGGLQLRNVKVRCLLSFPFLFLFLVVFHAHIDFCRVSAVTHLLELMREDPNPTPH